MTWLTEVLYPRRWQVIAVCAVVGALVGGVLALGKREADHAEETRRGLARQDAGLRLTDIRLRDTDRRLYSAIRRLQALENPSRAEVRQLIRRIVGNITPAQAQRLQRVVDRETPGVVVPVLPRIPERPNDPPSAPRPPVRPPPDSTPPQPVVPSLPPPVGGPVDQVVDGACGLVRPLLAVC